MKKLFFLMIPLIFVVVATQGCTALSKISTTLQPSANAITQAAIDLAVGEAVGTGPLQKSKAVAIKAIAQLVLDDSSKISVTAIEAIVNQKVAALAPNGADLAAFMVLTQVLQGYVDAEISKSDAGAVTAKTQVAVAGLATAVVNACNLLGA